MFSIRSFTSAGDPGDLLDRVVAELDVHALGGEQRRVLPDERVPRLLEDADEVVAAERLELDADREAALQLGDEVRDLRDVERAGGDEEHVVGLHHAVLGVDVRALDDGQQVALHAAARHVRAVRRASRPAILSISSMKMIPAFCARSSASRTTRSMSTSRAASSCVRSSSASFTLSLRLRFFAPPPSIETMRVVPELAHHVLEALRHVLHAGRHERHRRRLLGELDLDEVVVERPGAELRAGPLAAAGRRRAPRPRCSPRTRDTALRNPSPKPPP